MAHHTGHVFVVGVIVILLLANLSLLPFEATALSFQYDFSIPGDLENASRNLLHQHDSSADGDKISLTKMTNASVGRVAYAQPMRLWDYRTGSIASFSTSFSFAIDGNNTRGDGMAFFVGPFPPVVPPDCAAEFLGLYSNPLHSSGSTLVVAVEFDTFWNPDLDPPDVRDHVGIDINSIHSTNYTKDLQELSLYGTMSANITYDGSSKMMSVSLQLADGTIHRVQTLVDFVAAGLPQDAAVGFSGATGALWESHELLSWSFNSTDMADVALTDCPCKTRSRLRICMIFQAALLGLFVLTAALLYICKRAHGLNAEGGSGFRCKKKNENPVAAVELPRQELVSEENENLVAAALPCQSKDTMGINLPVPREFTYQELSAATNDFSNHRKLGKGSFGEVYQGDLPGQPAVAVKRLTLQSDRTRSKAERRKDFVTEIMTLGPLYHRNLVKLVGWCNGDGEHVLLVYELMAKRSVDRYLHRHDGERLLTWPERYKIVLDVGYAIEYLHTGCPNPVLHRDIKPSNVMLNEHFEAKLGDFGLVRQVNPGRGSLGGTAMAGDMAYLDPICDSKNTASIESEVYSFGVLLLEIATGMEPDAVLDKKRLISNTLVDAVQESYANNNGEVLGMADKRLNGDFDKRQMERVLVVGLLCVQQQREHRPKIRNVVQYLSDLSHTVPQICSQSRS